MQQGTGKRRGGAAIKPIAVIATALLLAAGLAAWWWSGRERAQAQRAILDESVTDAPASAASRPPLPTGRFADVRGELEVRARAGDARAAYRLGQVMSSCLGYESVPGGAFTETLARAIAAGNRVAGGTAANDDGPRVGAMRIGGRKLDDSDLLDMLLYGKDRLDAICGEVGDTSASVRQGDARAWLELAAEQGHTKAMVEYGSHAFDDLASAGDVLDHVGEVVARRERARGYLRRAFESGEPESLLALASAHGNRPYLGRDPARSLAYFKAYRQTEAARRMPPAVLRMIEGQLMEHASPAQVRDAGPRAAQILSAFRQRSAPP